MSVHATSWVLKHSETTAGARLVMFVIADHADAEGRRAWPSLAVIARDTRLSERQVIRILQQLQRDGEIRLVGWHGKKPYQVRVWCICGMQAQNEPDRGDTVTGDNMSPLKTGAGAGVTSATPRGDIEPSRKSTPPTPPLMDEPSGNHQSLGAVAPTFADFWAEYPKRSGDRKKADAEKKWVLAIKRGVDPELIVCGAKRYRAYCEATGKIGTEFVQQAPTWLNGKAWENEFELPAEQTKAPAPSHADAKLGTRVVNGRLVYTWHGRDLTIEEAISWHEDRNRRLPLELERALAEVE